MPNTKEVEQAAERKTLDMLFEHFVDHKNIDGPVTDEYIKQEYEEEFNLAMDLAIFGYELALSNPLEQSEKKEEWVSCSERLPYRDGDSSIYCLVMDTYSGIIVRPYNEYHNCWDQEDGDDHYTEAVGGKITHWMPLPNPPKSTQKPCLNHIKSVYCMMKASELRLGNITNYGIVSVISEEHIEFIGVDKAIHIHNVEPVPLTEEKLLELGFEKLKAWDDMIIYRNREVDIEVNNLGIYFLATKVESVHHLQNIYHALTGEELTPITK